MSITACYVRRLDEDLQTLPVRGRTGKLQMLRKCLSSGQGPAGDVVCRLFLSGRLFLLVHRLALILVPQLSRLLADLAVHPGYVRALPQDREELLRHVRAKGTVVAPLSKVCTPAHAECGGDARFSP